MKLLQPNVTVTNKEEKLDKLSECLLKESSGSSTRPIDDRTHSFKWGSREEDDTEGSYPSPNHHASPTGTL
ncbi:hypothetical protein TNCV_935421 [Trichonephila clavipes]|nr:hypothetical protein TNCV_935421 [Trichonephila clavipes]